MKLTFIPECSGKFKSTCFVLLFSRQVSMSRCICHSKINVVLPFFFFPKRFLKQNHQHLHLLKGREKHSRSQCVFVCFFILIFVFVVCCFLREGELYYSFFFFLSFCSYSSLLHRNNNVACDKYLVENKD